MRNRPGAAVTAAALLALAAAACKPAENRPLDAPKPGTLDPAASPLEPVGPALAGAWVTLDGRTVPARHLCDGLDRPQVIVVLSPNAQGQTSVALFRKVGFGSPEVQSYVLGPPDPGAGQIHYPLMDSGRRAGSLHTFSPAALTDPAGATIPTLTTVTLADQATRCRWVPNARFLGFTAKRSVLVTRTASGALAYTTFDFKTASQASLIQSGAVQTTNASLNVENGAAGESAAPQQLTFSKEDYGYQIRIGSSSADLVVSLGGAAIQTEPFVGWIYAGL
jgi:hypothetical protein